VESALNQEQRELSHLNASYATLNPHVSFLAPYLSQLFQSISNMYIRPTWWTLYHLKTSYALMALKLNCEPTLEIIKDPSLSCNPKGHWYSILV